MNRSIALICSALLLTACNQNTRTMPPQKTETQPSPQTKFTVVDSATAATIQGTIHLAGSAPAAMQIDMGMDPGCTISSKDPNFSQQYVVGKSGGLANVYVYVKAGLEGNAFAVPATPVILDQKGCRYEPHVLALMAGQTLRVLNSDPTTHNVHGQPNAASNPQWNMSQMPKGAPIEKSFHDPEVMMPLKCNQHPWMKAYVNVAANPFYAISDANGRFEMKGLPPGDYTIAAVHEALGEQTQKITVGAKENKAADFTFATQ
ncbi:MAG: carboxypeptidase regulatory-like domain-containing protein [Terriglobales bacterium]